MKVDQALAKAFQESEPDKVTCTLAHAHVYPTHVCAWPRLFKSRSPTRSEPHAHMHTCTHACMHAFIQSEPDKSQSTEGTVRMVTVTVTVGMGMGMGDGEDRDGGDGDRDGDGNA